MKTKAIIIAFLIVAQIGAFALKSYTQERDKCPSGSYYVSNGHIVSHVKDSGILLGDETRLFHLATESKIICDNEKIFKKIHLTHSQLFKRFTCKWQRGSEGRHKHYIIYIDKADANILIQWAKINL